MKFKISILLFFFYYILFAQDTYTIHGHFPSFPNSHFELKGYEGTHQKTLSKAGSKEEGKFTLTYPKNYEGVAQLWMNGVYQHLLFLNQENSTLYWEDLTNRDDLQTNSQEYTAFLDGMKTFQDSEAKLAGLHYLVPLYAKDSIKQLSFIQELDTVANAFPNYIKGLPENLFVRQYLLTKGLIEQMPKTVETYKWRAPAHIPEFMAIDFKALKHAGLYNEIIEGYTHLIERFPLEEINPLFKAAIDKVLKELQDEPAILSEIAHYWLPMLEKKSLFQSAEYLSLAMLNQENCVLDDKTQSMLEQYRKLVTGKAAPDIDLGKLGRLKNLTNKYKLVVFGTSWCPTCQKDYSELKEKYMHLKERYDLEIVYVSIDTNKEEYKTYYKDAPFPVYFDGKGWETQAVKDYHVFATPTYMLLDRGLTILEKIKSPSHLETWVSGLQKK